ncbi:MAG: bifunctional precorrin-2 dehydrogenase/sirohydrochlorin ferrochelatase [Magnetococcales bacterium]|nr:bifunctional precorrin-2 dehydrogenase/sirohydrochlorin ferrochelatase [Magnetococcales bacterium]
MALYMVELVLRDRLVLIAGGGMVAARKVTGMLPCGARLKVVAPQACPQVEALAREGRLQWVVDTFREGHLKEKPALVFAATGEGGTNREIARICARQGVWCNSADDPEVSGFLVPAVVRRGVISVGVGTSGNSPALARVLKERLEGWLDPQWGEVAVLFGRLRERVKERIRDGEVRSRFWREAAVAVEGVMREGKNVEDWLRQKIDALRE